jgi:hypothetical protein
MSPLKPSSEMYLRAHYNREAEEKANQLPEEKERILSAFLASPSEYIDSPNNRKILKRWMGTKCYDFAELHATAAAHKNRLEHRPPPNKPLKREVTLDEIFALYQQVLDANSSWLADTTENRRRVCELFTSDDPRISHKLDLADMVTAVRALSATLDRVRPPEPPKFPDDDLSQPLTDGTMPLPIDATPYEQRRATIAQQRNLVARLHKFEAWQREQRQEPR